MDFFYLFRVLLKRKWIILGATLLAAGLVYFLTQNQPKKYRSSVRFSTGFTAGTDPVKVVEEDNNWMDQESKFSNVIYTYSSETVLSLIGYKLILHDLTNPAPFRTLTENERNSNVYKTLNKEEAVKTFKDKLNSMTLLSSYKPDEKKLLELLQLYKYDINSLSKNISVDRVQRTDYIQANFFSENPELSAYAVNNSYQEFTRYFSNVRAEGATESIDTLKSILDRKEKILSDLRAELRAAGITELDFVTEASLNGIASLEGQLADEKTRLSINQSELQKVKQRIASLGTPDAPTSNNINDEILAAREAMNNAYRDYVSSGSNDPAKLQQYNRLRDDYNKKMRDLEIDIQAGNRNINSILGQIGALQGRVSSVAGKNAAQQSLISEAEIAGKEYVEAKKKYDDALVKGSALSNNFKLMVNGQPAINPEPSKRLLLVVMAGFGAFVTTILILVFLTFLDSSVRTPAIFQKTVNLKLISMVNFVNFKHRGLAEIIANRNVGETAMEKNRSNIFRESLRKLRYEIERSGKKIFLFTSTKKGQGKTTLIQALSYSLSLSKKKILIIDTNFCNNDLTVQLNAEPILEKIVPYKADDEALLEQVKVLSRDVREGSVFVIGSEGGDYTPSEILPRENLLQHLKNLTREFDYIFLEGPPLNDFSDSRELAEYVDGVIAVFSATDMMKQIDKQSISFFKELNGKFTGSILNKVDLKNVNVA
jgi:polysaccharide biosynthesis transport protein